MAGSVLKSELTWEAQDMGRLEGAQRCYEAQARGERKSVLWPPVPSARTGHFCLWKVFHNALCV